MASFIVRNSTTGKILRTGHCQESDIPLQAATGEISEENTGNVGDGTHYYNGTEYVDNLNYSITQDKTQITSDGVDTVTFSGIPVNTTVNIKNFGNQLVNDGELTYKSDIPTKVEFTFINFKYNTITLTVNVV